LAVDVTTTGRLRAYVAVADTGSVRAAAARLMVTESAVSAALAALTREVGVQLLERHGRGLRLTEPGRIFAGYAREILGLQEEGLAAARGDADPERARVRVAAVTTAGEGILPAVIVSLRERHPGVDLRLEVGNRERVWGLLAAREADLVIAGRPPRSLDVAVRAVRRNELVVVGPPGVSDPMGATWLLREAGSGTRAACQALLAELDADPATLTLGSNGAVVAGALVGLGVTLVSRDAVAEALAAGRLVELAVPHTPLRRPWHAVSHRHAPAAVELLVQHLCAQPGPPATKWRRAQLPRPGRHDGGHGRAAGTRAHRQTAADEFGAFGQASTLRSPPPRVYPRGSVHATPRHRPDRARPTRRRPGAVPAPGEAVLPAGECAAGRRTGGGCATSRAPHPAASKNRPTRSACPSIAWLPVRRRCCTKP
jgi:LysR family transcriptional regulator, low CO2-responsive transcriptional regulator